MLEASPFGAAVGQGACGSELNEATASGAALAHLSAQKAGHLAVGDVDLEAGERSGDGGLGNGDGVADESDLGLGLDDPHSLEDRGRIGQLPVRESSL